MEPLQDEGLDSLREFKDQAIESFEAFQIRFEELLQQFTQLHQEDKLFAASEQLDLLRNSFNYHDKRTDSKTLSQMREQMYKKIPLQMQEQFDKEIDEAETLLKEFTSTEGWTLIKDQGGVMTWYRNEKSSPVYSLKSKGIMNTTAFDIVTVINEIELFPTWIPSVIEAKEIHQISRFRKYLYMKTDLPWPMQDRDFVIYAYGVDILDKGKVIIILRSTTDKEEKETPALSQLPNPPKTVRGHCHIGGFLLELVSENSTRITMMSNGDPKLPYLPYWFLNYVTKHLAPYFFESFHKQTTKVKTKEYQEKIQNNQHLYRELQERLDTFLGTPTPSL